MKLVVVSDMSRNLISFVGVQEAGFHAPPLFTMAVLVEGEHPLSDIRGTVTLRVQGESNPGLAPPASLPLPSNP
jgi:hypothetical protein